ncbi:hypothetical protein HPB48_014051 [Haemaphysalis longicornis]|uniref:HAT C-terminal dimerisation domain-containing protein n=1 Tax=Haemaphysalis longicornis TaxID=44386 RepID=A0A9J6FNF7_HAELO|nr:hypothetical protein HPB48_014051 [Haemaphysalis longicornis]
MWTSRSNESYTSLTCHYLTANFELRAFALSNTLMTESHTACNILAHLQEMMAAWELPLDQLPIYFASDNARNFRAALRCLLCTPLQCLGHTLQLAIKDSREVTPGVPETLKKCQAIVGHYKHSAKATASLQDCQELPTLKLIQDVETRWNSEHDMLPRLLQLRAAVCLELATSDTTIASLTPQERRTVEGLVKALAPVASATKDLSGQKYATLSAVIPFLYGTEMVLKDCIAADDVTSLFAKNMLKAMKTRFVGYSEQKEYVMATACDPRFKNIFFREAAQEMVLMEFAQSELERSAPAPPAPCDRPGPSTLVPSTTERATGIWDQIEKLAMSGQKQLHASSGIEEFWQYLREPTCGRNDDPLAYWQTSGKKKYPSVGTLAMKYLGIPATQVPSENRQSSARESGPRSTCSSSFFSMRTCEQRHK